MLLKHNLNCAQYYSNIMDTALGDIGGAGGAGGDAWHTLPCAARSLLA